MRRGRVIEGIKEVAVFQQPRLEVFAVNLAQLYMYMQFWETHQLYLMTEKGTQMMFNHP